MVTCFLDLSLGSFLVLYLSYLVIFEEKYYLIHTPKALQPLGVGVFSEIVFSWKFNQGFLIHCLQWLVLISSMMAPGLGSSAYSLSMALTLSFSQAGDKSVFLRQAPGRWQSLLISF